jgi:hypothetical protein
VTQGQTIQVGVVHGSAASPAWLDTATWPPGWSLHKVDPLRVPASTNLLVWLWNDENAAEMLPRESKRLQQSLARLIRRRGNAWLPILLVVEHRKDAPGTGTGDRWYALSLEILRKAYAKSSLGIAPRLLLHPAKVLLDTESSESASNIVRHGEALLTAVRRRHRQLRRQATPLVQLGLGFTVMYLLLLLVTLGQPHARHPARHDLIDWSLAQWHQKVHECQDYLEQTRPLPLDQMTASQLQHFAEHLRWLPIAADYFSQKQPGNQPGTLRRDVEQLLEEMERRLRHEILPSSAGNGSTLVREWLEPFAQTVLGTRGMLLASQQHLLQAILQGVFDPRFGSTAIHQAAEGYWRNERLYTIALLRQDWLAQPTTAHLLQRCKTLLLDRLQAVQQAQIHAPPEQFAWSQELEQALIWCSTLQQDQRAFPTDFADPSIPALLREGLPLPIRLP